MRVYIANLGKYNEGELVGAWFTPPIDFDEVRERIGLNDQYEEYVIHDYELPFDIDAYTPIEEVNRLCEMVEELPEYLQEELSELQSYFGALRSSASIRTTSSTTRTVRIWRMRRATSCRRPECWGKCRRACKTISTMPPTAGICRWRETSWSRTMGSLRSSADKAFICDNPVEQEISSLL